MICDNCLIHFPPTDFNWTETGGALCDKCMMTECADDNARTLDDILTFRWFDWWECFLGLQGGSTIEQIREAL